MPRESDYIFPKEIREGLAEFGHMDASEAFSSPEFLNKLLELSGRTEEERNALWDEIGRPDFKL